MADRVGQQFGDYHLTRFLGRGSFGEVYLGEHVHKNTLAAIKVLQTRLTAEDLKEFINEASTTFRLQHPNIVRLLDFGIGSDDTPFLTMAYAPNGTLRQRYPRGTRLPPDTVAGYVKQIAAALQHAHNERLIHRDVKPENILLGPNDEVWLSDFGIAAIAHSTRSLNTERSGGTVPYMSPEQIQGKSRPASDQYALGIMTYEWLCGERPFNGTAIEIAMQHALTPPPSLREKVPTISPEVEQVVMTALAKDPHQRFESVQAFANALEEACQPKPPIGTTLLTYRGHIGGANSVAWSPDGRYIASGSSDGTVQIWDATTGAKLLTYNGHSSDVFAVAWLPNGKGIASGSLDGTVQIWDAATGAKLLEHRDHPDWLYDIALSPNGRCIALASGRMVQIWDAATGSHLYTYDGQTRMVFQVAWSPDSKRIASSSDGIVQVWNAADGSNVYTYHGHAEYVPNAAWSPDGKRIAFADAKPETVEVWDATTGAKLLSYAGYASSTRTVAWSPDGRHIASGSSDKTVQIWDATTGATIYTYHGHTKWVLTTAWSPDGERIASSSSDGIVHVWQAV